MVSQRQLVPVQQIIQTKTHVLEEKVIVVEVDYMHGMDISDVRLYKGAAKYTSNFIPTSTSPDILPDSPSGVAIKSKLKKITDGAVAFDGTDDVLRVPDHADLRFGTGAFTVECFVYFNYFDDVYPSIISKYTGGTVSWIMRVKNNGKASTFLYWC